jgi:hypothetical protein
MTIKSIRVIVEMEMSETRDGQTRDGEEEERVNMRGSPVIIREVEEGAARVELGS